MGEKRVRFDKKKDIKPTINIQLKDAIYRLAFITNTTKKDLCAELIDFCIRDREVIQRLSVSFVRELQFNGSLLRGHVDNVRFPKTENGPCDRIHMRITQHAHEQVKMLGYALDLNPSRVCGILLDIAMHDFRFLNMYVQKYLTSELSYAQMLEFREMLKYINRNSDNEMTMAALLSAIVDEVKRPITPEPKQMGELVVNYWRQPKQ